MPVAILVYSQKHIQIRFQWCSNVVICFSSRNFSINLLAWTPSFHKKVSGLNFVLSVYFTCSFKSSCSSGDITKMLDMAGLELLSKLYKIFGISGCLKKCSTPKKVNTRGGLFKAVNFEQKSLIFQQHSLRHKALKSPDN